MEALRRQVFCLPQVTCWTPCLWIGESKSRVVCFLLSPPSTLLAHISTKTVMKGCSADVSSRESCIFCTLRKAWKEEQKDFSLPIRTLKSWQSKYPYSGVLSLSDQRLWTLQGHRWSPSPKGLFISLSVGISMDQGCTQGPRKADDLDTRCPRNNIQGWHQSCPPHVTRCWEQNADRRGGNTEWGWITCLNWLRQHWTRWQNLALGWWLICCHSQDIQLNFRSKKYFIFL